MAEKGTFAAAYCALYNGDGVIVYVTVKLVRLCLSCAEHGGFFIDECLMCTALAVEGSEIFLFLPLRHEHSFNVICKSAGKIVHAVEACAVPMQSIGLDLVLADFLNTVLEHLNL